MSADDTDVRAGGRTPNSAGITQCDSDSSNHAFIHVIVRKVSKTVISTRK